MQQPTVYLRGGIGAKLFQWARAQQHSETVLIEGAWTPHAEEEQWLWDVGALNRRLRR